MLRTALLWLLNYGRWLDTGSYIVETREFIVRVIGTILMVSYLPSIQISIGLKMCKHAKTMKMKNNLIILMCIVCHSRVGYLFTGDK